MRARLPALPSGGVAVSVGLAVLGATAYLFLLVAGQVLGDHRYAPLAALWILVFLLVPALFYPVEQELSRAIAARRALGQGTGPLIRQAGVLTAALTVALVLVTSGAGGFLDDRFFDGEPLLLVGLLVALPTYALAFVGRGVFAGTGRFRSYGILLAGEGAWRLVGAAALAVAGVRTAGPYGLLIGLSPLLAVAVVIPGSSGLLDDGPRVRWSELSGVVNLVAAAVLSQVVLNAAPLVVKYAADAGEQAVAGAFAKAVIVSRIPLFMFQAVQAMMLPRLTHMATVGAHERFRHVFRWVTAGIAAMGALGTAGAFVFGPTLLRLFGSTTGLPRVDITLLAGANGLFLLAMATSQALVALRDQRATVLGWASGVVAFAVLLPGSGGTVRAVEMALVAGTATSLILMQVLLRLRLQRFRADSSALVEALDPIHLINEL